MSHASRTEVSVTTLSIPTYPEAEAEALPMFAESRVHQRTTGRPYPNQIVNGIVRDRCEARDYVAVVLENEWIKLTILPELGGRIFEARDKTNGYDFFYRQHVIKPALIGMLGSWVSGGAEFNWPLHHRPSTFMPVDFAVTHDADGAATVWLSEHEPLDRMKGMVGFYLHPQKARFETRVRLFNRTPLPKSFLFWQNIAVPVNETYQIFFPPDVSYVHFHYKRSVTGYPVADSMFNGIDFREGVDIRWHKNVKDATSFFCGPSRFDFFGGYDHGLDAGVIHVANRHVSPGKKLFTWGYNQLARTWERALTDSDGAYAELMAGSFSDNQPDFAWLEPYETKTFTQCWYPIKHLGEPLVANEHLAIAIVRADDRIDLRVYATEDLPSARIVVTHGGITGCDRILNLVVGQTLELELSLPSTTKARELHIVVAHGASTAPVIEFKPVRDESLARPEPLRALPAPRELANADELFRAGLHVEQYRDPLVMGEVYWREALHRNPIHVESHKALGRALIYGLRFKEAAGYLESARATLTQFNANPRDGEASYLNGLAQFYLGQYEVAYDAFFKATWNYAFRSAAYYWLACIDSQRGRRQQAIEQARAALETNGQNSQARVLLAILLRTQQRRDEAQAEIDRVLAADPLDHWARWEQVCLHGGADTQSAAYFGVMLSDPGQTCLDLAIDYMTGGFEDEAIRLLEQLRVHSEKQERLLSPMVDWVLAWLYDRNGDVEEAGAARNRAAQAGRPVFPSRIEEWLVIECELENGPPDAGLANAAACLLYARGRYDEARQLWARACELAPTKASAHRNLAMACFRHRRDVPGALAALQQAHKLAPEDPQVLWELEYVLDRAGVAAAERMGLFRSVGNGPRMRDDLALTFSKILNQCGRYAEAIEWLMEQGFVACEGGEHAIVEQYQFALLALGRKFLALGELTRALEAFRSAQVIPDELGAGVWNVAMFVMPAWFEATALRQLGQVDKADEICRRITEMPVDSFSYMYVPALAYYCGRAHQDLGQTDRAEQLFRDLLAEAELELARTDHGPFRVTPFFISYQDDPVFERTRFHAYLAALAHAGLGDGDSAQKMLDLVLNAAPNDLWGRLEKEYLRLPLTNEMNTVASA